MKKSFTSFIIIFLFFACHEPREQDISTTNAFNKKAGAEISMETAERWISRYRNDEAEKRFDTYTKVLTYSEIEKTLNTVSEPMGVLFHYAIDDNGHVNTFLIPISEDNPIWNAPNILNVDDGSIISGGDALALAERFKAAYPDEIRSHFFGIHVFEKVYNSIEFVHATSDDGIDQLLLFMRSDAEHSDGRLQGESVSVYDNSIRCPPFCDTSEPSEN